MHPGPSKIPPGPPNPLNHTKTHLRHFNHKFQYFKKGWEGNIGGNPRELGVAGWDSGVPVGSGGGDLVFVLLDLEVPHKNSPKTQILMEKEGGGVTQGGFWGGLEFRVAFGGSRGPKEDIAGWQLGQQ